MKMFKFSLFSIAMALMFLVSCTNDENVIETQQTTQESESISKTLNQLSNQFDQNGNLTTNSNPAGNVVFDFCFDFVYPLNLSFNNGTTVNVDSLEDLIDIMLGSTENLFINGVAFPFNVETYNEATNAIEIVTINNEVEFDNLLENCAFEEFETCVCTEEYNPVCVQITDPNGDTFTVTYPNACYAECDGFTENDFAENCEDDYFSGGTECFTLNFPLSIIIDGNTTVVINSNEELGTTLYDVYNFDFVYPFNVTIDNQEIITINSADDIEAILVTCYGEFNGGDDCEECENTLEDPICVEFTDPSTGEVSVTIFPNACYALCQGFTENDFVDCNIVNPNDCTEDSVEEALVGCQFWTASINNQDYYYVFSPNGSVTISQNGNFITSGTWTISTDVNGSIVASIDTASDNFSNDWTFICNDDGSFDVTSSAAWVTNIVSGCE
ncbi:hypothetical protein OAA67_04065 [Winogradskyella sp.]|nr:hypothetical protein [Winogradskyella sp.]